MTDAPTFEPVKLTDPNGAEHTATTAVEFNNLVYGQGYKPVQPRKNSPDAVAARTAEASSEDKPAAKT